jgi:hypothetical protein
MMPDIIKGLYITRLYIYNNFNDWFACYSKKLTNRRIDYIFYTEYNVNVIKQLEFLDDYMIK